MRKMILTLCLAALAIAPAAAQTIPSYSYPSAGTPPMVQLQCDAAYQNCLPITSTNPVPFASTPSAASTAAITPVVTAGAGEVQIKAGAGNLYSISVTTGANPGYVYVVNRTTNIGTGAVVAGVGAAQYFFCVPVAAATNVTYNFPTPIRFSAGARMGFSSTACGTFTPDTTAVYQMAMAQ